MSPEVRIGQLRQAVGREFNFLTRNCTPLDGITDRVRTQFTDIVMNVGGAPNIDALAKAVQAVGMITVDEKEVLYADSLTQIYHDTVAAQPNNIPTNRRTPEQILRDLKPGAARKLAEVTFQGYAKELSLVKYCGDTTYKFVHGRLVITANIVL